MVEVSAANEAEEALAHLTAAAIVAVEPKVEFLWTLEAESERRQSWWSAGESQDAAHRGDSSIDV